MSDELIVATTIVCRRCEQNKLPHKSNPHLCEECVKAENNRVSFHRRTNVNWMEVAKDAELQLWERQPSETDHEYHIWLCYRDAYPGKKPTYKDAAEQAVTSVSAVRSVASRWSFPARLQTWAKYVDEITLAQRQQEILDMNKKHVDMATRLSEKISKAIDLIDPHALAPKDINALMKTAAELESKARLNQPDQVGVKVIDDENPDLKKMDVKTENISEILGVLSKAGVLNNFGVKQTVTTEVVVKGDE